MQVLEDRQGLVPEVASGLLVSCGLAGLEDARGAAVARRLAGLICELEVQVQGLLQPPLPAAAGPDPDHHDGPLMLLEQHLWSIGVAREREPGRHVRARRV